MSIELKITKEKLEGTDAKVHFIPASIDGNGAIKINEYFNSYTETASGREFINNLASLINL